VADRHECLYCGCDRLTSPDEPPGLASVIICGACASLMVVDVKLTEEWDAGPPSRDPFLRRPTHAESLEAHRDPAVRRLLNLYAIVTLEGYGKKRKALSSRPVELPPLTIPGPG
jgi:hypothetical protein